MATTKFQSSNIARTEIEDGIDETEANAVRIPSCKCPEIKMLLEGPSKVNVLDTYSINTFTY